MIVDNIVGTVESDYNNVTGWLYSQYHRYVEDLPFTATKAVNTRAEIDLKAILPAGADIVRSHRRESHQVVLAVVEDARSLSHDLALTLELSTSSHFVVSVAAATSEIAWLTVCDIAEKVPESALDDDKVSVAIWQHSNSGPSFKYKTVTAPSWGEVDRNYPNQLARELEKMTQVREPANQGKIILWHGPPGTGKTSAIRTLMREWKEWCSFHYVSDPERMFQSPGYLMEVGSDDEAEWRLVIAEDSDDFLRADAKEKASASMARLLNFSDGILGQGSNTIFLLTTNEEVHKLHPALVRPGRCFAQLHFPKFTANEVRQWLPPGTAAPGDGEAKTLAELIEYTKVTEKQIAHNKRDEIRGQYL